MAVPFQCIFCNEDARFLLEHVARCEVAALFSASTSMTKKMCWPTQIYTTHIIEMLLKKY